MGVDESGDHRSALTVDPLPTSLVRSVGRDPGVFDPIPIDGDRRTYDRRADIGH